MGFVKDLPSDQFIKFGKKSQQKFKLLQWPFLLVGPTLDQPQLQTHLRSVSHGWQSKLEVLTTRS